MCFRSNDVSRNFFLMLQPKTLVKRQLFTSYSSTPFLVLFRTTCIGLCTVSVTLNANRLHKNSIKGIVLKIKCSNCVIYWSLKRSIRPLLCLSCFVCLATSFGWKVESHSFFIQDHHVQSIFWEKFITSHFVRKITPQPFLEFYHKNCLIYPSKFLMTFFIIYTLCCILVLFPIIYTLYTYHTSYLHSDWLLLPFLHLTFSTKTLFIRM